MKSILITIGVMLLLTFLTLTHRVKQGTYIQKVLLGFDMFVSLLIFRDFDISISSKAGLALNAGKGGFLAGLGKVLNKIAPGHCAWAILDDKKRAEAVIKELS